MNMTVEERESYCAQSYVTEDEEINSHVFCLADAASCEADLVQLSSLQVHRSGHS